MGKNTISGIMKSLVSGTIIENSGKRITNHSGRKTAVKKLKQSKIPESSIIKLTGHKSTAGLKSYDPEDEDEFREMSNAIASTSRGIFSREDPNAVVPSSGRRIELETSCSTVLSNPSPISAEKWVFNSCTVTINNNTELHSHQSKKKKYVIYDSDSQSQ